MTAKVTQSLWAGEIPLFQFAIFYNMNMEINPGGSMSVNGRVHSNGNLWASGSGSGSPLTFGGSVDAAQMFYTNAGPWHSTNNGNVNFTDSVNNPVHGAGTIYLPVGTMTNNSPTNVVAILNQPPPELAPPNFTAAYSTNGQVYYQNAVDLIVSNAPNGTINGKGTNIVVYYQNPNFNPQLQVVPPDVTNVDLVAGTTNYTYSFVTNGSFYDYREAKTVQSVDINVGQLKVWMTHAGSVFNTENNSGTSAKANNANINSIYVVNSVPQTTSTLPAVRMVNGQQLPASGLTVATGDPLYVQGDYNVTQNGIRYSRALGDTTNTYPASLLGDAVTLLSNNWNDNWNSLTPLALRTPTNTVLNAATLEGIVPSLTDGGGTHYSGGVENFLRLLENWSGGNTVTYNGSIVVMFPSQHATNAWNSAIYAVPTRRWGFDLNFTSQQGLPPLTPKAKRLYRTTWTPN
jgi:hypothetical protein